MAYGGFNDLARTTASDKVLKIKAFNIAKNPKCNRYQRGVTSIVYNFFDKKSSGSGIKSMSNQLLPDELYKQIIKKLKKKRKYIHYLKTIFGVLI